MINGDGARGARDGARVPMMVPWPHDGVRGAHDDGDPSVHDDGDPSVHDDGNPACIRSIRTDSAGSIRNSDSAGSIRNSDSAGSIRSSDDADSIPTHPLQYKRAHWLMPRKG